MKATLQDVMDRMGNLATEDEAEIMSDLICLQLGKPFHEVEVEDISAIYEQDWFVMVKEAVNPDWKLNSR